MRTAQQLVFLDTQANLALVCASPGSHTTSVCIYGVCVRIIVIRSTEYGVEEEKKVCAPAL